MSNIVPKVTRRAALVPLLLCATATLATPPDYTSFDREQKTSHTPVDNQLLRIWAINIGQGDAFLIQLPTAMNAGSERIDILVDGGPGGQQLPVFLKQLYGDPGCVIEHAVLTHHDNDHVAGLTTLLNRNEFALQRLYHNSLVSWRPTGRGFQNLATGDTYQAVFSVRDSAIDRGMAFLQPVGGHDLKAADLITNLTDLKAALAANELEGIYESFAQAINDKATPQAVQLFDRTDANGGVLPQFAAAGGAKAISLRQLWPSRPPHRYGSSTKTWAYTINANSVTFKLTYGDFEMLFTGDHNDESERELLDALPDQSVLRADVLKVPHHGSAHSLKEFVDTVAPVVSIASMGKNNYGHPSADAVKWAGGAHRIYHTHIHERKFPAGTLSAAAKQALIEDSHVLIETDGTWFRIVETDDPRTLRTVSQVTRGDGTRWIKAQ